MAERPLRILQVSTVDIKGGAERVAWNLFTAYRARGHSSWLAVGEKRTDDPDVLIIPNQESRGRWHDFFQGVSSRLKQIEPKLGVKPKLSVLAGNLSEPGRWVDYHLGVENFHFPGTKRLLTVTGIQPDIVHAHNLHGGYFDLRMLPKLSQQVPTVMTLHDAWLLSGHCAHSFACEKWKTGCGECPDLSIYPEMLRDSTRYNWQRKREIYSRSRLCVATPSQWLMRKVEESMLAPAVAESRVLPNGVDLDTFHPADRQAVRAQLNIRQDAKVLLAMGVSISQNRWKDYHTMREAVSRVAKCLERQDLLLIALGEDACAERIGQAEIRFVPFQRDVKTVARYCQAADLYVHAALADTFPTSILEAMACGTPVVATAVGGIPEQVEEGRNGFLVPAGDAAGLATRIMQVFSDCNLKHRMGILAAQSASQRFGLDRQVDAYIDWYHELVGKNLGDL